MAKILIVEDDPAAMLLARAAVEDLGHTPVCAGSLGDALGRLKTEKPDLLLLDLNLPDGCGVDLAAAVRRDGAAGRLPIIAFTGRAELDFKKRAFGAGVDQYLVKPVAVAELQLWINSLLRRVAMDRSGGTRLAAGQLEIDQGARIIRYKGVPMADLTNREFDILACLVMNSPNVLTREYIISQVWRTRVTDNLVDAHIHNLRKKLPEGVSLKLQSVSGKGYRYLQD